MKNSFLFIFFLQVIVTPAQTNKYLDKNKVKARIHVNNDKFSNLGAGASYEVPKGSGKHAMFGNSIWIGGLDNGGQLHIAANTYKQSGTDFWPGPLDTVNCATYNAMNSAPYNRVWKVDCNDITDFVNAFNNGSVTAGTYTVPNDILNYPAMGGNNFQRQLHPFFDANNNGIYDPLQGGDYPIIKGDQQILSIFNDQRDVHTETQGANMGVEIHEKSYAYYEPLIHDSLKAINYSTFYHYTIYNRSNTNYHDVYVSDWSDFDLGYFLDDYIGCDTINDFAYAYNGNPTDPTAFGTVGYGNQPPVASHALLPTDCSNDGIDNDGDLMIDEAGETFRMDVVSYYNNNISTFPPPTTNPGIASDYYNYMRAIWKDNSPFTFGGNSYSAGTTTKRVYPGNPATNSGWTEATANNPAGDRRLIMSSGPFNFPAHSKIEWGFAIVFSQDTVSIVNTITQFNTGVQRDVRKVKLYESMHQIPQCAPTVVQAVGLQEVQKQNFSGMLYPNPATTKIILDLNKNVVNARAQVTDVLGNIVLISEMDNTYHCELNTSMFSHGLYLVTVNTGTEQTTLKFVKE